MLGEYISILYIIYSENCTSLNCGCFIHAGFWMCKASIYVLESFVFTIYLLNTIELLLHSFLSVDQSSFQCGAGNKAPVCERAC